VAANPALCDEVVNQMLRLSEGHAPASAFAVWLERKKLKDPGTSQDTLFATYENLCTLHDQQRNHIWGYVARNLSRPVWLSTNGEKVHILIGNPPWLPQHDMSRSRQQRLREECKARGIWAGGKVATHQDLSAYFFARCAELYLRKDGVIAFVMPYATMSRQQYEGFRNGVFAGPVGDKQVRVHGSVRFIDAWTFDDSVQPLFKVPSCVLFAREGEAGPLPPSVTAYYGELPHRDASVDQATNASASRKSAWPETREDKETAYGSRFRQGATVVPRFLFLVRRTAAGRFGANPKALTVESRRTNLEKKPWKDVPGLNGPIGPNFFGRSTFVNRAFPAA
jgi:hypothetical protein